MATNFPLECDQGGTLSFVVNYSQNIPSTTWAAGTDYNLNDVVNPTVPNGFVYSCTAEGESDATEPDWPLNLSASPASIVDGSVIWTVMGPAVELVDLTDYTAYMSVGPDTDNPTVPTGSGAYVATISTTSGPQGVIALGGAAGTVTVTVLGSTTLTWSDGPYYYDLFLVPPSGLAIMLIYGQITMNPNVTIPTY